MLVYLLFGPGEYIRQQTAIKKTIRDIPRYTGMRPPVGQRLTGIGRRAARGWIISGVL